MTLLKTIDTFFIVKTFAEFRFRFGFLIKAIFISSGLYLAGCTPLESTTTASTSEVPAASTSIQTEYGAATLGQILNIDGKYFYVSESGLLPVDVDASGTARIDRKFAPPTSRSNSNSNLQYVMLAFDGSRSLDMWRDTRQFARQNNIKFTYFVSGVYFLNESIKNKYRGPGRSAGVSHIGWAKTANEVGQRLEQVNAAFNEGHEIATHANGHFDGSKWSRDQWRSELRQFHSIMENAYLNNGLSEPFDWREKTENRMFKGFRAPLLGVSSGLGPVLREFGYTYDTSRTGQQSYMPKKIGGVYNFPLANVKTAHAGVRTLSMDYNFYVAQSKGKPRPSKAQAFEDEMYETYMRYFRNNYSGNRAPVDIGHHFSLWNNGAYWKAMKRFAREVCGKPDVRCATYTELQQYLDSRGGINVASR